MALGACFGTLSGTIFHAPIATQVLMLGVGAFGGLVPDLDTKASYLGQRLPNWWHKLTPGHRRFTHSIFYCAIIFAVAWVIQTEGVHTLGLWHQPARPYVPIALTAGALSHLFGDAMTSQGIPIIYPISHWKLRLFGRFNFATGTAPERIAVLVVLVLTGAYVMYPLVHPVSSGLVHARPLPGGIPAEPVLVFVVLALLFGAAITAWSLWRAAKHHRRRRRYPSRARAATRPARQPHCCHGHDDHRPSRRQRRLATQRG